jgi:hypothetical protein
MYEGLAGEYVMSWELHRRQVGVAHPRVWHQQELARLDAQSRRATGWPSLPVRLRQRVARACSVVGTRLVTALAQMPAAHDGSIE